MHTFQIRSLNAALGSEIQHKIDVKTKPLGSLGVLEEMALKIGKIQGTAEPKLERPTIVVFAGDHGIARHGVSAYPQEVTYQMVMNFLNNGAAINVFCALHNIDLKIVDAGVNYDFLKLPSLINAKIGKGTQSFLDGPAMTKTKCEQAIETGADLCQKIFESGTNVIGFGEMGIGNTSAASMIMSKICRYPIVECIGRGSGLDDAQLERKIASLEKAFDIHRNVSLPLDVLRAFGGFEMAMMCGAMLCAAENRMIILVDGFIATSVFLIARCVAQEIDEYAIFCHQSDEYGHKKMLAYLKTKALLNLGMRLGEGTGCALAYPIIKSSVAFLNDMASFESAGVSQKK